MPGFPKLRLIVGGRLEPDRGRASPAVQRIAMVGEVFDLLQIEDEADRSVRFRLDRDDPPIGPQVGKIRAESDRIAFRKTFALNTEKDRFGVVRAKKVTAFRVSGSQHDVPAPAGQLPRSIVRSCVTRHLR